MNRDVASRPILARLARFVGWLAAREQLPPPPPPRPRAARAGWLATLLRSDALPPASLPGAGEGEHRLNLGWLLSRETLPDPPPRTSGSGARGLMRWLLSSERLPERAAEAASGGEKHDQ